VPSPSSSVEWIPYPVVDRQKPRYAARVSGYSYRVSDWDDDWTGEPPEGRHSAARANPGFWRQNRAPLSITATGVGIALIILVVVWLL
jgi:hypothetical protein